MSWLLWVALIVALILVFGFMLRVTEGFLSIALSVLLLAIIVGGLGWVLLDVYGVRQHLYSDEKLFLLDLNGQVSGAFFLAGDGPAIPISDLSELRLLYPDLPAIRGDAYKVIVMTWSAVAGNIELEGFSANAEEVRFALESGRPKKLFVDKAVQGYGPQARMQFQQEADRAYPSEDAFASTLFAVLAQRPLNDSRLLLENIRLGSVLVYPETITFKLLKVLPEGIGRLLMPQKGG